MVLNICHYIKIDLFAGGYTDTAKLHAENKLLPMLRAGQEYNYDFIVIGGGSGGLAAAKVP